LAGGSGKGGGFSTQDYYAGGAFGHGGFGLLVRLIPFIIECRKVVFNDEDVGLLYAKRTADAADFAHLAGGLSVLDIFAGDGHHIFVREGHHFNKVPRAGLCAGAATCAFVIVNSGKALDDMQGVEFAGPCAVAITEAAETAGLNARLGVGGRAGFYAVVGRVELFVRGVGAAVHDGSFGFAGAGNLQIKNLGDFVRDCRTAGCALSEKFSVRHDGLCVGCAAGEAAGAAIDIGKGGMDLFDLGVNLNFKFYTRNEKNKRECKGQQQHGKAGKGQLNVKRCGYNQNHFGYRTKLFIYFSLTNHSGKAHKRQREQTCGDESYGRAFQAFGDVGKFEVFPYAGHDADRERKADACAEA
jgi:uncharacterized membrane protein